jgi:hypothetical protein
MSAALARDRLCRLCPTPGEPAGCLRSRPPPWNSWTSRDPGRPIPSHNVRCRRASGQKGAEKLEFFQGCFSPGLRATTVGRPRSASRCRSASTSSLAHYRFAAAPLPVAFQYPGNAPKRRTLPAFRYAAKSWQALRLYISHFFCSGHCRLSRTVIRSDRKGPRRRVAAPPPAAKFGPTGRSRTKGEGAFHGQATGPVSVQPPA